MHVTEYKTCCSTLKILQVTKPVIKIQKPKQEPAKGDKEHSICFAEYAWFYIHVLLLLE